MGSTGRVCRRCGGFPNPRRRRKLLCMTSVVQPDAPELPADADALRALVLAMMAEREALTAGRDTLQAQNERLAHLLLKLRRLQFGRKAERLPEEQLQLGLEDLEQAIAQEEAQAEKRDPALREARTAKRRARRGALPAHLPRVEVTLAPQETACPCCRAAMTLIGEVRGTVAEGRVSPRSRAARRHPRPGPGDRDPPAEARLPGLPGHGGADLRAGAADRGWPADRGAGRPRPGIPLRRPPAPVSPGADHGTSGRGAGPLHAGVLGWLRRRGRAR